MTPKKTKKKKKGGGGQGAEEQHQAMPLTLELGSVLENLEVFHTNPGGPFHTNPSGPFQSTHLFCYCHLGSKVKKQQVGIQHRLRVICAHQEQIRPNQTSSQIGQQGKNHNLETFVSCLVVEYSLVIGQSLVIKLLIMNCSVGKTCSARKTMN